MNQARVWQWIKEWRLLLIPFAGASSAVVTYVWVFHELPANENPERWGAFGDYVGGLLNPLVSVLILFVAVRVWQLQKVELEQTKAALKDQAKTAEQQRQEQRFFDLLNLYQQTVSAISVVARVPTHSGDNHVQYSGKEAIAQILRSPATETLVSFDIHSYGDWLPGAEGSIRNKNDLLPLWNKTEISSLLDHYFRMVFRILYEAEQLLGEQHIRYVELFRAQLSRAELIVIGFNLWLDDEDKELIPLAEKYGLLKHLSTGNLRTELETCMPLAFGQKFATATQRKNAEATPC